MKVTEHLDKAIQPLISFEIIPPKRGGNIKQLLTVLDDLVKYNPPFIDITSHAAEAVYEETPNGMIEMKIKRKRPGTLGICALVQNKYNIDAVPHVLCTGFTKEETEDFLIELHYLGIDNVFALRGDNSDYKKPTKFGRSVNEYASDLIKQISDINKGIYLEKELLDSQPMNFCIGTAGYPEKHYEAPNLMTDIKNMNTKINAGASYIVTQMFYNNNVYFDYVDNCRKEGITIPIIPGLKIITSKSHIKNIPKNFYIDIPQELTDEIENAQPQHVLEIGVDWTKRQVEELLNRNVPAVHFYVMQNAAPVKMLMDKINY